jgi:plasmid stabilization system protein ParE
MLIADIGADALLDLDLQFEWYADVADEDVAERYLSAFHETKEQLCLQPDLGVFADSEIVGSPSYVPSTFEARFKNT